ncbi:MAG: hypothetical protein KGJ56_03490 [Gammaproteobacteria bacterium]|nr:hypothetical protein [Gammaproteobacteria bacterium]
MGATQTQQLLHRSVSISCQLPLHAPVSHKAVALHHGQVEEVRGHQQTCTCLLKAGAWLPQRVIAVALTAAEARKCMRRFPAG